MKKGRFLWSAYRITERWKAGKARNIKGKQLKNSRNTDLLFLAALYAFQKNDDDGIVSSPSWPNGQFL
ncbi:hypothetical protein CLOSTHATH_07617 [Hungatella hathewayi DSM 13479]|uniref:Uncharacterized protein n=1 Tax=Hungatella hathewayi DSM 13479 TaxID=566550 RepID=D3AVE1_9FIRM|nr:hypothetical protein CLOSTHATH_07617 [Hungatella hathewayi DSM 13479]